ncbi:family 10 glycosylhydrolase [Micrococcales bacterium 31B]|nr:family 10 glycosylhydrolase [Micrococcales bacterium 31B]
MSIRSPQSLTSSRRAFLAIAASVGAAVGVGVANRPDGASAFGTDRFRLPLVNRNRELRGTWIATVANLNWPTNPSATPAAQQKELQAMLDNAVKCRLNAVFFQVRPMSDAFYASALAPWSSFLTGTQGKSPGWDPLAFAILEAHKRGLELHAWLNPYRVASKLTVDRPLAANNIAKLHPEWTFTFDGGIYLNPGIPQVSQHLHDVIDELTRKYNVDGVHFDDYFYPYPIAGQVIPDDKTYAAYNPKGLSLDDWRRDNVNRLVAGIRPVVRKNRPRAQFGISPFGIWRNKSTDPRGSDTAGTQSYDQIFADTYTWVKKRWIDYIAPQVYWDMNLTVAAYSKLVPWWANVVKGTGVRLYIGEASYKIGTNEVWKDPEEMVRHLELCAKTPLVRGNIWFSSTVFFSDPLGTTTRILETYYKKPAPRANEPGAPSRPQATVARRATSGVSVEFLNLGGAAAERFTVYRRSGNTVGDAISLTMWDVVGDVFNTGAVNHSFLDVTAAGGATYTYYITAVGPSGLESAPVMAVVK